jgi:hypothetical protein
MRFGEALELCRQGKRIYRTGWNGFDRPKHKGCPFQQVCGADNAPAKNSVSLRIINAVDAETLEAMAKAIRSTMKEVAHETSI